MHFSTAALLLLANAVFGSKIPVSKNKDIQCHEGVHVFAVPFHGGDNPGIQSSLIEKIGDKIHGTAGTVVLYKSNIGTKSGNYSLGIKDGVYQLIYQITQYDKYCPGRPIALMGWSEGGIIVMNTLCGALPDNFKPNIVSAIVYGEETYIPNQRWNRGTCTNDDALSRRPRQNPAACDPWGREIRSYCEFGDAFCCGGENQDIHDIYRKYDDDAATFTAKRYWQSEREEITKTIKHIKENGAKGGRG